MKIEFIGSRMNADNRDHPPLIKYMEVLTIFESEIKDIITIRLYSNKNARKIVCNVWIYWMYGNDFYTSGKGVSMNGDENEAIWNAIESAGFTIESQTSYISNSMIDDLIKSIIQYLGCDNYKIVGG